MKRERGEGKKEGIRIGGGKRENKSDGAKRERELLEGN